MNYQITILQNGHNTKTLSDILPISAPIKMLIIGKTPVPVSVEIGHYFQGKQGKLFWGKLQEYDVLKIVDGKYEDEFLIDSGYGITDIVKMPRHYGNEPSEDEYKAGWLQVGNIIKNLHPIVTMFVYKGALDKVLMFCYSRKSKSIYGFNPELDSLFNSKVFAFPMPGTPCTKEKAHQSMSALCETLFSNNVQ